MASYAYAPAGTVVEIISPSAPIASCYTAEFVAQCHEIPANIAVHAGDQVTVANGVVTFSAAAVVPAAQQPPLRAKLAMLDSSIPRGLEDYWAASSFDVTKLPADTQTKLQEKQTLRAQLAALIVSKTP